MNASWLEVVSTAPAPEDEDDEGVVVPDGLVVVDPLGWVDVVEDEVVVVDDVVEDEVVVVVVGVVTPVMARMSKAAKLAPVPQHVAVDGQLIAPTATTSEARVCVAHALPPSAVATMDGEVVTTPARIESRPVSSDTAQQSDVPGQLILASGGVPAGRDSLSQLTPPSLVAVITPSVPVGSEPAAQQSVAEAHDTPMSGPAPLGAFSAFQIAPWSVVASTSPEPELLPPVATQVELDEHEMAKSAPDETGRTSVDQVTPSVVSTTTGASDSCVAVSVRSTPSAKQVVSEVHEIEVSSALLLGAVSRVQLLPPSSVSATVATKGAEVFVVETVKPTAQQSEASGQEMAMG